MTAVEAKTDVRLWGVVAEFATPKALYDAAHAVAEAGYRRVDSHTPFPIHGIDRALRHPPSGLGWFVAGGGIAGIVAAQLMQWWMNGVDYPFWVSGKPPYAWESTIPITFELMVLLAALTAVFGMFILNGLPRLHHPVFKHSTFHRVSDDRFFLSVEARDPKFDRHGTAALLEQIGATNVEIVED
ncbi:MAG: DUF3341 domain-containing protein [Planctomycetes bacterium]|nr:DUF3341 domain-containing protein [Planctomycetota bacterium]